FFNDLVALGAKAGTQEASDGRLVVNHEHTQGRGAAHWPIAASTGRASVATGKINVKIAPDRSRRFSASIEPPIASIKPRQIATPNPVPARCRSCARTR